MIVVSGLSFRQPKFCPSASWASTAVTLANITTVGVSPYGIFVNTNNNVYVPTYQGGTILIWLAGSMSLNTTFTTNSNFTKGIFVSSSGDIYLDNGNTNHTIGVWRLNESSYTSTLSITSECYGIFVHTNGSLYCSMQSYHMVVNRSLNSSDTNLTTIAGTGCAGPYSNLLYYPSGIFVTIDLQLYVADSGNDRIQLFLPGQVNATTVAG